MTQDLVEFSLEPRTLEEAFKLAELISKSDLVPKDYQGKPGNVLIAVQMGRELGLKPMQALQNISVVNGRPSVWGDAPLALVMGSGLVEDKREDFDETTMTATLTIKRKGVPSPHVSRFSMEDAKKANLWNKAGSWTTSPKRMLQLRARGFGLRDVFPDVLKGLSIGEEQQDIAEMIPQGPALPAPPKFNPPRRLSQPQEAGIATPGQESTSTESLDPVAEWEHALLHTQTIDELHIQWMRLCPVTKNGFYQTLPQDQQARLLAAKNTRKQQFEHEAAAVNSVMGDGSVADAS